MKKGSNNVIITNALQATLDQYSQEVLYHFSSSKYAAGMKHKIATTEPIGSLTIEEKWVSFEEMGSDSRNKMKKITVTIYWFDQNLNGATSLRNRSLTTWVNNYLDY